MQDLSANISYSGNDSPHLDTKTAQLSPKAAVCGIA